MQDRTPKPRNAADAADAAAADAAAAEKDAGVMRRSSDMTGVRGVSAKRRSSGVRAMRETDDGRSQNGARGSAGAVAIPKRAVAAVAAIVVAVVIILCLVLSNCSGANSGSGAASGVETAEGYILQKEGVLTVATSADYPPFESLQDGQPAGFEVELIRAAAQRLGLDVEFKDMDYEKVVPAVAAGNSCDVGVAGISISADAQEQVDFTVSYYVDDFGFAVLASSALTEETLSTDLNATGKRIAVADNSSGSYYVQEVLPQATVQTCSTTEACFAALRAGKCDAVCANTGVMNSLIATTYTDVRVASSLATGQNYAMVLNKGNEKLTQALNAALKELQADGTIDKLKLTWL